MRDAVGGAIRGPPCRLTVRGAPLEEEGGWVGWVEDENRVDAPDAALDPPLCAAGPLYHHGRSRPGLPPLRGDRLLTTSPEAVENSADTSVAAVMLEPLSELWPGLELLSRFRSACASSTPEDAAPVTCRAAKDMTLLAAKVGR